MNKCVKCGKMVDVCEGVLINSETYCPSCEVEYHVKQLEETIKLEYEGY